MDVGNMRALRLLLVTQCPLHSQDERLTGRTGAVAAADNQIAYLQTLARLDAAAVLPDCSQIGCEIVVLH